MIRIFVKGTWTEPVRRRLGLRETREPRRLLSPSGSPRRRTQACDAAGRGDSSRPRAGTSQPVLLRQHADAEHTNTDSKPPVFNNLRRSPGRYASPTMTQNARGCSCYPPPAYYVSRECRVLSESGDAVDLITL